MKQTTNMSVMIGAIPGALPPLIGYTAVVGRIDEPGMMLFLVQFFGNFLIFGRLLGCYTTIIRRRVIGCCHRLVDGIKRAAIKYLPIRFY
jgi:hypothetical protein